VTLFLLTFIAGCNRLYEVYR